MTDNKINTVDTDNVDDDVNVKERATIFGPRKVAECKVKKKISRKSRADMYIVQFFETFYNCFFSR